MKPLDGSVPFWTLTQSEVNILRVVKEIREARDEKQAFDLLAEFIEHCEQAASIAKLFGRGQRRSRPLLRAKHREERV